MPIINRGHYSLDTIFDRQVGNDWPTAQVISTADVIEASTNLYYTDERSSSNTINLMQSFQGDNIVIEANGRISASISGVGFAENATQANTVLTISNFTTDDLAEGSNNLYYTNDRVISAVTPLLDTANVVETDNLYYTNDRVISAVTPLLTTANVLEDTNLYYTNDRVISAVTPLLDTANVVETDNLYYTNARVLAALEGQDINLNDVVVYGDLTVQGNTVTLNTATLTIEDKNIVLANGAVDATAADGAGITIEGAQANIIYLESGDKFDVSKNLEVHGNIFASGDIISLANLVANGLVIRNVFVSDDVLNGNTIISNVLIVDSITANTWSGLIAGEFIEIEANGRISANIDLVSNAQTAQSVQSLSNFTTDDLTEGTNNLYYTNSRTRSAFTAGFGIIIQENGVVSRTSDSELFNLDLDGSVGYIVTDSMQELISFPATPTDSRYLVRSLHITNTSDQDAFISANVLYASGNVAHLASRIPVPEGGVLEFLKKTQVLSPGDRIHVQGYDNTGAPASGVLNAILTYQTVSEDFAYIGEGSEVIQNNTNVQVYLSDQSYTIFESIKLVNLEDYSIKTKVLWADANDNVKSYIVYNIPVPPNSSIELLQNPKRIEKGDKIYLNHQTDGNVAIFLSGRLGEVFVIENFTQQTETGGNIDIVFQTTEEEGTLLYYSIDE